MTGRYNGFAAAALCSLSSNWRATRGMWSRLLKEVEARIGASMAAGMAATLCRIRDVGVMNRTLIAKQRWGLKLTAVPCQPTSTVCLTMILAYGDLTTDALGIGVPHRSSCSLAHTIPWCWYLSKKPRRQWISAEP